MIATFGALAHIAKGKTKEELQQLLHLRGNERLAFGMLADYLNESLDGWYDSLGFLLARTEFCDPDRIPHAELREQFGVLFQMTDFSETDVKVINDAIARITQGKFTDVVRSDPLMALTVCTATSLNAWWHHTWEMESEEQPRFFRFDEGRKRIPFLKGTVNGHQIVTVNGNRGYRFQLEATDLTIVQCRNSAELKQLARTIARDGLRVQPGRNVVRQVSLHIPEVRFNTEFDFREYAKAKGRITPFTWGAEFTVVSDDLQEPVAVTRAEVKSSFEVDESGIALQQITIAEIMAMSALREERRERRMTSIVIDSPYLMVVTERRLGTILGMAFIASPEIDWGFDY
jgi:serine protease inhibitor